MVLNTSLHFEFFAELKGHVEQNTCGLKCTVLQ